MFSTGIKKMNRMKAICETRRQVVRVVCFMLIVYRCWQRKGMTWVITIEERQIKEEKTCLTTEEH